MIEFVNPEEYAARPDIHMKVMIAPGTVLSIGFCDQKGTSEDGEFMLHYASKRFPNKIVLTDEEPMGSEFLDRLPAEAVAPGVLYQVSLSAPASEDADEESAPSPKKTLALDAMDPMLLRNQVGVEFPVETKRVTRIFGDITVHHCVCNREQGFWHWLEAEWGGAEFRSPRYVTYEGMATLTVDSTSFLAGTDYFHGALPKTEEPLQLHAGACHHGEAA